MHRPTMFDNNIVDIAVEDEMVELDVWDTSGEETHNKMRAISYKEVDVVIICFSIGSPASLQRVVSYWEPEVR